MVDSEPEREGKVLVPAERALADEMLEKVSGGMKEAPQTPTPRFAPQPEPPLPLNSILPSFPTGGGAPGKP